jgi:8-oxo-dGTP pyrophosphatase MutT (NUDIX family)
MVDRSSAEPAPREAATIVLARAARDGGVEGVEVVVVRRAGEARFVPGFVVFPGGAIEPGDRDLARRWFGTVEERARACALRELAEEAGLLLRQRGTGTVSAVARGRGPAIEAGIPIRAERLPQIGRWVAPEFLDTRFDARFFAAAVDGAVEPTPDGAESDAAWWARPRDLLDGQRHGAVQLAWPTFKTLEALVPCTTVEEVLALRVEQVEPPGRSHVAPRPPPAVGDGEDAP